MQKWEYIVIDLWPSEGWLNQLGDEGWELVAVATISAPMGGKDQIRAFLKRPKNKF
jgi:hypothetical protein